MNAGRSTPAVPSPGDPCPCGAEMSLGEHCGPIIGGTPAPTAEALMRSRYTAHAIGDLDYVRTSWHPDTCPDDLADTTDTTWIRLVVHQADQGQALDAEGTVEFTAHYERRGVPGQLHEVSRFVRRGLGWVYLDGMIR